MNIDFMRKVNELNSQLDGLIKPEIPLAAGIRPLFFAYNSVTDSNVTGDSTQYTIIYDTEIVDRNSNYNNATGIFTAPVTGYYLLITCILATDFAAGHTTGLARIVTSNRTYNGSYVSPVAAGSGANFYTFNLFAIADMDAADTAYTTITIGGGAKTCDIFGGNVYTWFQGYLLP